MRLLVFFLLVTNVSFSQFSKADSLRGGYGETRNWWDLIHYDLSVEFQPATQTIKGSNSVTYSILKNVKAGKKIIQIDLQEPLILDSIIFEAQLLPRTAIRKEGNAYFFETADLKTKENSTVSFTIYYHGKPRRAVRAPWDGGVIWKKDENGLPWITVACQGLGSSVWFPCKDSQYDEPDSVDMHYTCPSNLKCVSNGRLVGVEKLNE